ncbi:putative toxin-antitoxin system toxin component, PIN family [Cyanobium sp. ATX 6F1]|uniref:putative toxin-antitoxin system toxin component, PIN family n=1 Tax=unclassified Cyanobium TaxID=2627006 RepID=UPI0020CE9E79|nr:putative toxin-antitoxin system toxin component, PIN family [Cyanobium sp. ATX 6F1]MCP9917509.1 putative toxin-antitoxin system toxin component, PIN family [Cyanobium sp. ATX 6F1]
MRVVLDTNVLVSALLFQQGRLGWMRQAWQSAVLVPVVSKTTTAELLRVLTYPKFRLAEVDRQLLLEDVLPFVEVVAGDISAAPAAWRVRDPDDQNFLDLALVARVEALVTGDQDLLAIKELVSGLSILTPALLEEQLSGELRQR